MLKDIYTGSKSSNPSHLTDMNGTLFFQATDGVYGKELWKSDGTPTGTLMVKDIYPGIPDAEPADFVVMSDTLFFRAADGWTGQAHGAELWRSDGTPAGTLMVKDIISGPGFSFPHGLLAVNGALLFVADDGSHGYELWTSDGTPTSTVLVKDIYSGTDSSSPGELTGVTGTLFFNADDGSHGAELWAWSVEPEALESKLSVNKSVRGNGSIVANLPLGGVLTYSIELDNNGDGSASDVVLTDRLPLGVSFGGWLERDAATLQLPPAGETIRWGPQDIAADTQITIRFTATITTAQSFAGKIITNTAYVSSTNAGFVSGDAIFNIAPENNTPPTISNIADQKTFANTSIVVSFTVGDMETPLNNLALAGEPSNTTLVSADNLRFGGNGAYRNLTVIPTAGLTGTSTLTVTVDEGIASASDTFELTVVMRRIFLPLLLKNA